MSTLIDLFSPREILHMVGVSNQLKILETSEKKFLLAVRMGAKREDNSWTIPEDDKMKFYPIFSRFMNCLPENHECDKKNCPVCERFRALKHDFNGNGESEEYNLLMKWVSMGQAHYSSPKEEAGSGETMERFSSEVLETKKKKPVKAKKKRVKVVAVAKKEQQRRQVTKSAIISKEDIRREIPDFEDDLEEEEVHIEASPLPESLEEKREEKPVTCVEAQPEPPVQGKEQKTIEPEKRETVKKAYHPFIEAIRELAATDTEGFDREDLSEYCRRSKELFDEVLEIWDRFAAAGDQYRQRTSFSWEEDKLHLS